MTEVIRTEGLTKVYKSPGAPPVVGLNHLDTTVYQGEVYGLVGPNGSGKTTTLKLLLGLLHPSEGTAFMFGQDITKTAAPRERVGFMPDGPYFYDHLNAYEVLDFYAAMYGMDRKARRERIDELLDLVDMKDHAKRRLKEYSKGMVQRIGLAQALLPDPDLVLLDEPTAGLDPLGAREMRKLIFDLRERSKTVFLCSHLLAEIQKICDRVTVLYNGNALETLTISKLDGDLEDRFVALVEKEVQERGIHEDKRGKVILT